MGGTNMAEVTPTSNPSAKARRRPRWLRYSLRTLLVLVLVVSLPLAWLGFKMKQAADRAAAVERIRKLGGTVIYDYQRMWDDLGYWRIDYTKERAGHETLRRWLGNDFFDKVVEVRFAHHGVSATMMGPYTNTTELSDNADLELPRLAVLGDIEYLDLSHSNLTDAGLAHVAQFKKLRWVNLSLSKVTPAGAERLRKQLPQCNVEHFVPKPHDGPPP
jgi:hypothetical protein